MQANHDGRSSGQRERILELLQEHGTEGVTNTELNAICFRYGARIWELRRAGHNIKTENLGDGVFKFRLLPPSTPKPPQFNVVLKPDDDYARRTQELRDRAMPLFAGVRRA